MIWPDIALICLIIFWSALIFLITYWPRSGNKSISQHAASHRSSYIFFTIVQAPIGFILWVFMLKWFIPHFQLSTLFTIVYTITAWLQIVVSFIPDRMKGKTSVIHLHLANEFALGMFILAVLLCFAPTIHGLSKLLFVLTALYMVYSVYILYSIKGKPHLLSNYLYLQIAYIVSFQVSFILAAFSIK